MSQQGDELIAQWCARLEREMPDREEYWAQVREGQAEEERAWMRRYDCFPCGGKAFPTRKEREELIAQLRAQVTVDCPYPAMVHGQAPRPATSG